MEHLIQFLMPFFFGVALDIDAARAEILETLACCGARIRSELLNVAQIVAFGMSALDVLAEAKVIEMSPSTWLRFRACANGLNRAGQQHEKALALRLACDVPDAGEPMQEPVDEVAELELQEAIQLVRAQLDNHRNRLSGPRPATGPHAVPEFGDYKYQFKS